ncbi:hypothetical protein EYF80_028407 [Liparis tanakae]|uniref:Uncharacterized protein n=1 Tax=Liparis tanakae TaxID=230148 RepID=A0A4Z2H7B6_9TELE|nr:hypothetical protein EYF80_028407 [Liparis tanakae]
MPDHRSRKPPTQSQLSKRPWVATAVTSICSLRSTWSQGSCSVTTGDQPPAPGGGGEYVTLRKKMNKHTALGSPPEGLPGEVTPKSESRFTETSNEKDTRQTQDFPPGRTAVLVAAPSRFAPPFVCFFGSYFTPNSDGFRAHLERRLAVDPRDKERGVELSPMSSFCF